MKTKINQDWKLVKTFWKTEEREKADEYAWKLRNKGKAVKIVVDLISGSNTKPDKWYHIWAKNKGTKSSNVPTGVE